MTSTPDMEALPAWFVAAMRQLLLSERRHLLGRVADIDRLLGIGRFTEQAAPLASVSEQPVDWVRIGKEEASL